MFYSFFFRCLNVFCLEKAFSWWFSEIKYLQLAALWLNSVHEKYSFILQFYFYLECYTVPGPKRQMTDLNIKTGWYHARGDTLPHFSSSFVLRRKWGRVSCLAWHQSVLTFRSLFWRYGSGTVNNYSIIGKITVYPLFEIEAKNRCSVITMILAIDFCVAYFYGHPVIGCIVSHVYALLAAKNEY